MTTASPLRFNQPVVLVLTATVDPGPYAETLTRRDPAVRMRDYVEALRYWQHYPDPRIAGLVFCDNSGADLSEIAQRCPPVDGAREIECLGFRGNERPPGMHYGYAELGTIDHVVAHSRHLSRARHFVKITGRLRFPGLTALLDSHRGDIAMSLDSRRAYARETGPRTRARTQLMIFETEFYRTHLAGRRTEMSGVCTVIEEFLALKAEALGSWPGVTRRWRIECPPVGITGSGRDLRSVREQGRTLGRRLLRRIAPDWWL